MGRLPIDVLIVDLEAQYHHTIDYIYRMVERNEINPYWICLPLSLRNVASQFQPKWICWNPDDENRWLRPLPTHYSVISDLNFFLFLRLGWSLKNLLLSLAFGIKILKKHDARA